MCSVVCVVFCSAAGKEIVHAKYKPSCVFNVDDHPQRVQNDVPNSTNRTDFVDVNANTVFSYFFNLDLANSAFTANYVRCVALMQGKVVNCI